MIRIKRSKSIVAAAVFVSACPLNAWATSRQPTLDELLGIELAAPDAHGSLPQEKIQVESKLQRHLDGKQTGNPFEQVIELMDTASDRLALQRDPGLETQRVQELILKKLDQVIEEAAHQQAGASSASRSSKPSGDGDPRNALRQTSESAQAGTGENRGEVSPGRVERVDPNRPLMQQRREWGHLPPRLRAELRQGLSERFSPIYQTLTEAYFRRLAEE